MTHDTSDVNSGAQSLLSSQDIEQKSTSDTNSEKFPFNFPFQPYNIQVELMQSAYDTFEASKFALLESPTGTGKSLSLICSSLTWLKNYQAKAKSTLTLKVVELNTQIEALKKEEEECNDWISVQAKIRLVNKSIDAVKAELNTITSAEQRNETRWLAKLHHLAPCKNSISKETVREKVPGNVVGKRKLVDSDCGIPDTLHRAKDNDEQFLLDDEVCDEQTENKDFNCDIEPENHVRPKIYYASRTHSQLCQFVNELKKTKFANNDNGPSIKVAQLASRANYCINLEVSKLKDPSAINDRCGELQKETNPDKRCPYLKAQQVDNLKEAILTQVHDIEDVVSRGKSYGACPYYSVRRAIPEAELIVLPYNNLLHQETRKASSLDLKESIVIVDEAHNVLETICSIHSASITRQQLLLSHYIFSQYFKRYYKRMKPQNVEQIRAIVKCLAALIRYLNDPKEHITADSSCANLNVSIIDTDPKEGDQQAANFDKKQRKEYVLDVNKFISAANIENFNIFKIVDYISRSNLTKKLQGFFYYMSSQDMEAALNGVECDSKPTKKMKTCTPLTPKKPQQLKSKAGKIADTSQRNSSNQSSEMLKGESYPIYAIVEFFRALTNHSHDGRVLTFFATLQESSLKFLLLNPSSQFKQMVADARSIVLAGGTMQPFGEFIDLLFGPLAIDESKINLFSCGHIIPNDHLAVATLSFGPTSRQLELSYKTRNDMETIDEYGRTISNLSMAVPGGMVCFLPSYDWESICYARWKHIGIITTIESRSKKVYREPKKANEVQVVLEDYAQTIKKGRENRRGALLLSVVGGKVSEGINFNDDLGRCVIMLGLPFANIKSAELQQKLSYYTKVRVRNTGASSAGQQYYQNLCTKGINQSIGRAIRHKDDYAAIVLLDRRYSTNSGIREGLPKWIASSLTDCENFNQLLVHVKNLFDKIEK